MEKDNFMYFKTSTIIGSFVAGSILAGSLAFYGTDLYIKKNKEISSLKKTLVERNEDKNKILELNAKIKILEKRTQDMMSWKDTKSFVIINKSLLVNNLRQYKKLSPDIQSIIIDNVIAEATKYNINPIILYSLLDVESSMRFHIQHQKTSIKIKGKQVVIRAVGLGGVVWEWWDEELQKANIAKTRTDLFLPGNNIKAVAFILNEMYKKPLLNGCKSKDESMLRRYFGGNFKSYSDKINLKVMSIVKPNLYRY